MTASVLPTATELAAITNLEEAKRWAGARDPSCSAWHLRVLAEFPPVLVARQAFGMEDVDPLSDLGSPASPGASSAATPSATRGKKVKAASVLDQLDESEVPLLSQAQAGQSVSLPCRDHWCGSSSGCRACWRADCSSQGSGGGLWGKPLRGLQCLDTDRKEGAETDEGSVLDAAAGRGLPRTGHPRSTLVRRLGCLLEGVPCSFVHAQVPISGTWRTSSTSCHLSLLGRVL